MKVVLRRASLQAGIASVLLAATSVRFASESIIYKMLAVAALLAIFLACWWFQERCAHQPVSSYEYKRSRIVTLFAAVQLFALALAISSYIGSATLLKRLAFYALYTIVLFALAKLILKPWRRAPAELLQIIYGSLLLYVAANILLFLAGIEKSWADLMLTDFESGKATMLGALGLDVDRVVFILSSGANSFGIVCAMLFGLGLNKLIFQKRLSLGLAFGLVGILLTDMRSALPFVVLAMTLALLIVRWGWHRLAWLVLPIIPFLSIVPLALGLAADSGLINAEWMVRRGDAEALTLNGRTVIWGVVLLHFLDFKIQHVWGHGAMGQVAAGISDQVAATPVFGNYADPNAIGMHNSYLQVLVDTGYLGLSLYLVLMVFLYRQIVALKRLGLASDEVTTGLLFVYLLIAIGGNTETPNQFAGQLFSVFVFLWMYFLYVPASIKAKSN